MYTSRERRSCIEYRKGANVVYFWNDNCWEKRGKPLKKDACDVSLQKNCPSSRLTSPMTNVSSLVSDINNKMYTNADVVWCHLLLVFAHFFENYNSLFTMAPIRAKNWGCTTGCHRISFPFPFGRFLMKHILVFRWMAQTPRTSFITCE